MATVITTRRGARGRARKDMIRKKASSTQGCSRTVPQFSTDRALRRLTAEFERDPVYSTRYGRWRSCPGCRRRNRFPKSLIWRTLDLALRTIAPETQKRPACALARRFTLSQNGYGDCGAPGRAEWGLQIPDQVKSQQHPRVFPNGPPIQY